MYYNLTREQAKFIKQLRIVDGGRWGYVSARFVEKYPNMSVCSGNQFDGMWLCESAMDKLGEKLGDGWN